MRKFDECLRNVVKRLADGSILVTELKTVQEKQDHFCSILKDIPEVKDKDLKRAIELRCIEASAFEECIRNLKQFIDLCHRCDGNSLIIDKYTFL